MLSKYVFILIFEKTFYNNFKRL